VLLLVFVIGASKGMCHTRNTT